MKVLGMYRPTSFQMNEEFNKKKKKEDTKKERYQKKLHHVRYHHEIFKP